MSGGEWRDRDVEAVLADRLRFIGALLEEDPEPSAVPGPGGPPAAVVGPDGPSAVAPEPGGPPVAEPGRRRTRAVLFSLLGLAAAVAVLIGVWAPWSSGGGGEAKLDQSGIVACSKLVAVGTVAGVESAGGGRVRVGLDVERYLKPATGSSRTEFLVPEEEGAAYRAGDRVLVSVSRFAGESPLLFTGTEIEPTWEWMAAEYNRPNAPACPGRG
ncbi:hypothetical protein ACGF3G_03720 [Streptomyces sp. NPDC048179]|uniref:hypothetical protein n=1 Tax=Streptomyces sp. NPDC048179 TaxID=3365506 RepID=UPI003715160C